jgi:hypothetical protein
VNQRKKAKEKKWDLKAREKYYRGISRFFLEQRGAPFFLSSQELNIIAEWEQMAIPLRVVLDGLRQAFEHRKKRAGRQVRFFSLNRCNRFVLEAHKQHLERHIGGEKGVSPKELSETKGKIIAEINRYLAHSPRHLDDLNRLLSKLRSELRRGHWNEEDIEKTEARIEAILVKKATPAERRKAADAVRSEYGNLRSEEFDRILRLRLIKELRHKYRIPYVSPFYF